MSPDKPKGAEEFDESYWRAYRARARKRSSIQMALVIIPIVIVIAVLKILEPMTYPAGDFRNSLDFRLLFYGAFILFGLTVMAACVGWLLADRRHGE